MFGFFESGDEIRHRVPAGCRITGRTVFGAMADSTQLAVKDNEESGVFSCAEKRNY